MINAMQNINVNRKELNKMQNCSICFMHGNAHLVNSSKSICFQFTGSDYEIVRNEVYTSAIANDISAIDDSVSAIENDTLATDDAISAIANFIPAIEDDTFVIENDKSAIENTDSAIKDDHFANENDKPAIENDTPAYAKYVFAEFGTYNTTYSKLKF
jgi:hypothetical protein